MIPSPLLHSQFLARSNKGTLLLTHDLPPASHTLRRLHQTPASNVCSVDSALLFVTEQTLATTIWNGDVHIGTDGSVANDDGTYGFAILIHLNAEEPTLAASLGRIMPPIAEFLEMDSHRPEAGALFAAVTFLESFLSRYPNPM